MNEYFIMNIEYDLIHLIVSLIDRMHNDNEYYNKVLVFYIESDYNL